MGKERRDKETLDVEDFNKWKKSFELEIEKIRQDLDEKTKKAKQIRTTLEHPTLHILGRETVIILKYIMDNQDKYKGLDEGITKQEVAKYMDENEFASRPTTLKLIEYLLSPDHGIILDDKKRDNARSKLILHPGFDIRTLHTAALIGHIKRVHSNFEIFDEPTKGQVTELTNELIIKINDFRTKYAIPAIMSGEIESNSK